MIKEINKYFSSFGKVRVHIFFTKVLKNDWKQDLELRRAASGAFAVSVSGFAMS